MKTIVMTLTMCLAASCTQRVPRPHFGPSGLSSDDVTDGTQGGDQDSGSGVNLPAPKPIPDIEMPTDAISLAAKEDLEQSAGKTILYGQHEDDSADPTAWARFVRVTSGRSPAMLSLSLGSESSTKHWANASKEASSLAKQGVKIVVSWEPCSPNFTEACPDALDKGRAVLTDRQWSELFQSESALHKSLVAALDALAENLKLLGNIPVIFRPFPRIDRSDTWWGGRMGEGGSIYLYDFTRHYLLRKKEMKNLLFVLDIAARDGNLPSFNPKTQNFDIVSLSLAETDTITTEYWQQLKKNFPDKIFAAAELGQFPNAEQLAKGEAWAFIIGHGERMTQHHNNKSLEKFFRDRKLKTFDAKTR